jgi:predicted amidohydrolase YtcJ
MLIRNATFMNGQSTDIRTSGSIISDMARVLPPRPGEPVIDARGGAVLPGLHDHHIHLFALAASLNSFDCAKATTETELARALRSAATHKTSLRAVNYHDSIAGPIDRRWLDAVLPHIPVRVQHRSGRLWILNSAALRSLPQTGSGPPWEYEDGVPTGRLYDADTWLRGPSSSQPPNLARVGRMLAQRGVTAVTDATPANTAEFCHIVARAQANGDLPQRVAVMGTQAIAAVPPTQDIFPLALKLHLHEGDYPAPAAFFHLANAAKTAGLGLAVHCVTEADIIFTLSLLEECGATRIARIEHASIVPRDLIPRLAAAGVTIVTQPHFIAERGNAYAADIPLAQQDDLYRCATLRSAGIKLGGGSDAPFGHWDPWLSMYAATTRRAPNGTLLGRDEILTPEQAIALFTTPLSDPGGAPRRIEAGQAADICLLTEKWATARRHLATVTVRATLRDGQVIHNNT